MTSCRSDSWKGRDDGPGLEHARWHNSISPYVPNAVPGSVIVGFASDEGVRRNQGRVGATEGPNALREALASLARHDSAPLYDAGDAVVSGDDLESGQRDFANLITRALSDGHFTFGLGGGHEIAYASYSGIARALDNDPSRKLGILNIDAHFDLRVDERATSGTGFSQIAQDEAAAGRDFCYAAVGISPTSNTRFLFDRAGELGVTYMLDEQCRLDRLAEVISFVRRFIDDVDHLYLTLDLDALPAAVAPGVSAPAAYGVSMDVICDVLRVAAESGKLLHSDIAELNPSFDVDGRTARSAARLINHTITTKDASS
ncbi:formimidoylglutamase [Arthrobacter castelli]|uniref:formimidoylglutamase n=1 Tax=Arthrobacter castelli TaxID=271431 RepID=UPI00047AF1F2|nr:formimidoylglutamase [Arthrobacter castelli]